MRLAVKVGLAVLVLVGAMYLFAYPTRTYLAQRSQIALQERTISVLQAENARLASERSALQSDATIVEIARAEYGLVLPGQQAFMVLPSQAKAPPPPAPRAPEHRPWYASLEFWHQL
jgi:cell division protein FtsL